MRNNFTLLKTFTLILIAFNFSCQKYEENTITETTSAEESLIPESIHYQYADDAEKKELTNLLTNQLSKFGYSKKDINLEMNQNPIMERTDSNGAKSYSMLYGKIDFELPYFYNVVIKKRTDGTYETPFLVRYENDLTLNSLLGKSINNISWEATVLPLKITPKTARYHEEEEDPCAVLPLSNSGNSGSFNPIITLIKNKEREEPSSPSSPIGGSKNTAILEICSPTIQTTTYECNGPNSDTDHPAGPNSGDSGDNSCGDSSTNFGGSGGGFIVGQACYQIAVEIVGGVYATVQDYSNSIEEFKGKNYCMLSLGREAMEISRKQNKLSSEDKDYLGKLNFYLNQTTPPAEGCDDFNLYINDEGILKIKRTFNIIEDNNPFNGLSSRNIVFEEKCPTLGGVGINIPTQINLLINKLNTFTLSSDPLSQEGIIFLLTPENWQIAKGIDTYVSNNNNSTKAIEFAKATVEVLTNGSEKEKKIAESFLNDDIHSAFDIIFEGATYTNGQCPPDCNDMVFDAPVDLTASIFIGFADGLLNLYLTTSLYDHNTEEGRKNRGLLTARLLKESGISIPDDINPNILYEMFRIRSRKLTLVLEPANQDFLDTLGDLSISLLDVMSLVSPGSSSSAYLLAKTGGNIGTKAIADYLKILKKGNWKTVNESMSDAAKSYQEFISGKSWNQSFELNGYKFDAIKDGILSDAKSGYLNFVDPNTSRFKPFFNGGNDAITQARNQINAAEGLPIVWHFEHKTVRDAFEYLFRNEGFTNLTLKHTPRN
ncbi:hypothetical protein I2486_05900 [Cellulophaga sp. E16_2]|uniref:Tox-REase-5 domain-containing protein n=1 Tax=Cellulophaga sp. E16_2 TaxID=2789297 RepID=UPI001A92BBBA|nr:Tox-REase-5 domain-containing protein [Cellulophaga sp. E16_2]MBO0590937.1 hypothetical protein [Cellulophaga sp. E16_2]